MGVTAVMLIAAACGSLKVSAVDHPQDDQLSAFSTPENTPLTISSANLLRGAEAWYADDSTKNDTTTMPHNPPDLARIVGETFTVDSDFRPYTTTTREGGSVSQRTYNGPIVYTPKPNSVGIDRFQYEACVTDTFGVISPQGAAAVKGCQTANVYINVTPPTTTTTFVVPTSWSLPPGWSCCVVVIPTTTTTTAPPTTTTTTTAPAPPPPALPTSVTCTISGPIGGAGAYSCAATLLTQGPVAAGTVTFNLIDTTGSQHHFKIISAGNATVADITVGANASVAPTPTLAVGNYSIQDENGIQVDTISAA